MADADVPAQPPGEVAPAAAAAAQDGAAPPAAAAAAAAAADGAAKLKKAGPKRKVAIHLAYLGAGYHGMQRNPGYPTIEAELEGALVKAGAISEQNAGSFMKIHWMRAARTDKGVSAACQVVSAKLVIEPQDTFVERVNAHLPQQIRIFGFQRTTDGFDARKFCDKRKYEYILPAWVFDPSTGRGRGPAGPAADAAAAQLQAIADAVASAPAPAAGGREAGAGAPPVAAAVDAAAAASSGGEEGGASGGDDGGSAADEGAGGSGRDKAPDVTASSCQLGDARLARLRAETASSRSSFVFGPEQLARLNALLRQYEGTHNFHNYTIRVNAVDSNARRYVISFAAELKTIGGQPWVKMVVVGQSFMLHQIRKMVGMAVAVMRGAAPADTLALALDPDRDFNTPMAPELGLFLDETYYDAYNAKYGGLHGPVTFETFRAAAEGFKDAVLYPHIATTDGRELINALWLTGLSDSQYRFSSWHRWQPVRNVAAAIAVIKQRRQEERDQRDAQQDGGDQQQQQRGKRGKPGDDRRGGDRRGQHGQQQQQQPASKQQRLERPGKHAGASPAMVVGGQETYGMQPYSDTPSKAAARQELKEMRAEQQQQQQQQRPPLSLTTTQVPAAPPPPAALSAEQTAVAVQELDGLYDLV